MWQANMNIQTVLNEYKAVAQMCLYFWKGEDQYSQAIKKAAKDAFENHLHHYETKRTISGGYLSKLECSVQKAVNQILPELKLRRVFLAVHFVNINVQKERAQVLLSKKELNELPNDSKNIFIKSNIDRYIN